VICATNSTRKDALSTEIYAEEKAIAEVVNLS
jgi:hypothetical protein